MINSKKGSVRASQNLLIISFRLLSRNGDVLWLEFDIRVA